MADYFVGPVMEKLIEACFEYLKYQVRWKTEMKEELQKLRDIHPQIQAVVSAYSQVEIKDPALNKWLWKLRDAVDEADDVLDEFEYRKREEQVSKNKKIRKVRSLMKSLKKGFVKIGKRALKIDSNLKKLEVAVQNLYKVSAEVSTFLHLLDITKQEQQQKQLELHKIRETGSMPTNDLFGRRMEMEFVRQWLRKPYQTEITNTDLYSKISLLSVVGLGGMGKTTLLQHVYEDAATKEFDVKMWTCVSDNFDVETVITNILKSLKKENINLGSFEALQRSLQSEVTSNRFLLVLDDIWEADETKWKNVLAPLHYGSAGSKILITTRLDSVASMFAKMIKKSKETLPLKGLEEEEFLQLFNTHAFAGVENPDDEFISVAEEMVPKLSGCPLAAKVIGGILNLEMDKSYWEKVLNTNIGNVGSDQNYLLSILRLSYIYLPKYLQNCFAFCCIFPQDHNFDKNDLVRMWIALGFVQSSNIQGETLEDTGRRYFNILVQKSFFDEFLTEDDEVCYKIHDLLHELAQSVSTQEYFKVVDDEEFPIPPETTRYLSLNTDSSFLKATFMKMGNFKNLRSLFLSLHGDDEFDENLVSLILKASKSIRLLVISSPYHSQKIPEMICRFIHLRYLKVECSNAIELPRSISHLYHLQFIISNSLQISEMDEIVWKELMPNENCQLIMDELVIKDPSVLLMEPMRSISSFPSLSIEENDELVSFASETEEWFLQHISSLFGLKFCMLQSLQSLPSFLESLSSLETLQVYGVPHLELLPNPPASLQTLELYNLESLQCLPPSLPNFSSLETLELKNIPLLKSLPDLPSSLKRLNLEELESLQCLPSSLWGISSLQTLKLINIPLLESVQSLQSLPSSLESLSSLIHLDVSNVPQLKLLPNLPASLITLMLYNLESLQCLPSSLSAISSLRNLILINIPLLKSLPDLPSSLSWLQLEELENLDCMPSCLPPTLEYGLSIIKVPRLLELPDLPACLKYLNIEDCHPQLMERYPNFNNLEDLF